MERTYGWKRQKADSRDRLFVSPHGLIGLPPKTNNRALLAGVQHLDQEARSCCTSAAICRAVQFDQRVQEDPTFQPSMEFLYYATRALENAVNEDDGAEPRDAIQAYNQFGVCHEPTWPFSQAINTKPSDAAYVEGLLCRSLSYQAIPDNNLLAMRQALADGTPFVFGIEVYPSFESDMVAKTGIVPMPDPGEQSEGGHYVFAVDYDDTRQVLICQNSWGEDWGQDGDFELPYAYASNPDLAGDFWVIKSISDIAPPAAAKEEGLFRKIINEVEEVLHIKKAEDPKNIAQPIQSKDGSRLRW